MSESYRINAPDVTREVFENEVVIVDFIGGTYYSLDAIGTDIWKAMESGLSSTEIVADLCKSYDANPREIEREVRALLEQLVAENLILREPAGAGHTELNASLLLSESRPRRSFSAPVLAKFTDMQDLLLLDPIHDVDETGWPARPVKQ